MAKSLPGFLAEQDCFITAEPGAIVAGESLSVFCLGCGRSAWIFGARSNRCMRKEEARQPPYHPRMMTKILLYGQRRGIFLAPDAEEVGGRCRLRSGGGNEPDFRTISDFRKLHLSALQGLFDQMLQIALQAGTMKAGASGVGWQAR